MHCGAGQKPWAAGYNGNWEAIKMTISRIPDEAIAPEDYAIPDFAYLLERDYGSPKRNKIVRDLIVHGTQFEFADFFSEEVVFALEMAQAEIEENGDYS